MVEETVLAARPAVEPLALLPRLSARLGQHPDELLHSAQQSIYALLSVSNLFFWSEINYWSEYAEETK